MPQRQPLPPDAPLTGRLLVAAPGLIDPNFARTVVLVVHHDQGGSLGLVLNRPSPMELGDPLPQWAHLGALPRVVFFGGPVGSGSAIGLALSRALPGPSGEPGGEGPSGDGPAEGPSGEGRSGDGPAEGPAGWRPLVGRLGIVDLSGDPERVRPSVETVRVFAGYAGWGRGQLPGELAAGGWLLVDARPEDPFSDRPESLWKAVLRRQGGDLAVLSAFPLDVSAN